MKMELILGHNQFIGISHLSEEKSIELEKKFYNAKDIYRVVESAASLGYRNMIFENHPRMLEFLKLYLCSHTFDMDFYLQVPYIQGYIKKMNETGLSGLARDMIHKEGLKGVSAMALRNVINLAQKNYLSIAASAIELETSPLRDANIKALLMHNVTTDLLLSLQVSSAFTEYVEYVKDNLNLNPGFTTVNFPLLKKSFEKWDMPSSLIMTSVNIKGYDMNPSKVVVESSIKEYNGDLIAMNVLGGGAFSIREANNYLKGFKNIKSCVVGASSREHLIELIEILGKPN